VIHGAIVLLRHEPYDPLFKGVRMMVVFGGLGFVAGSVINVSFHGIGLLGANFSYTARYLSFPLLIYLILREHRKLHPTSPLARVARVEEPLPLLR
jgi:hypothetical protein